MAKYSYRSRLSRLWLFSFSLSCCIIFSYLTQAGTIPRDYSEPDVDTVFSRLVREYTTDLRFLSPLVSKLPESKDVPSPRDFLSYIAGTPQKQTSYSQIKAYMEKLEATSRRVRLIPMGKSYEGRERIVVFIAEEKTLKDLETYAGYTQSLADPRSLSEGEAESTIEVAKPFYYLTGGLHSTETGSPEMLMELAYRLAVGESPMIRGIRNRVITMITPVLEVDGWERMVDWYYKYTVDKTDWEESPPRTPPYWGKYTYHDNNRDGIQLSQPLSRNLADIFFRYHPQVTHDLHESLPYLYISSGTGPYNNALDPIITSEWQWMANHEVTELTKFGMPGVWTWGFYTGWYPGYLLWFGNNHNSLGRFYETFGNAGATTIERELKRSFAKRKVTTKEWYRPWPPDKKVKWSLRNNINYQETGVLVALDFAARNSKTLLYNFWKKGKNAIERGKNEPPYAWIIPEKNQKKAALSYLINQLVRQGIEVHRLDKDIKLGKKRYPKGSFVVRMDQPYRNFAKSLMEEQRFPKDAPYKPYDDVAWTLPLLYGVVVERIDVKKILDQKMSLVKTAVKIEGIRPKRKKSYYVLPCLSSGKFLEARIMLGDAEVYAADTSFRASGRLFPRGSWIIPGKGEQEDIFDALARLADSLSLDVFSAPSIPKIPMHLLDPPRIAVFHTWTFTQNSGWVRYTFDVAGIPYTLIDKDDLKEGNLRERFDVILIPDLGSSFKPKRLVHGIDTKWRPMPYRRAREFPHIGIIDSTHDLTGGMGFIGLNNLDNFIKAGGTLVTLGGGSILAVEMGLVRHVERIRPGEFMNPGSIVRARVTNPASPIAYGYDSLTTVFRGHSPLFSVPDRYKNWVVLQYGLKAADDKGRSKEVDNRRGHEEDTPSAREEREEKLCVSGFIKGEKILSGKPAILDIRKGKGRVIIFSFNPLHRFLTHADFAFAYNAILHWND